MAKLLQTLIPILSSIALLLAASNPARSASFQYDFWGGQPTNLTYQGAAHFPPESTFLRLTDAEPHTVGRVLHTNPIEFWPDGHEVDFESTISFIITPKAGTTPGDGLTFFIAPVGSTIPCGSDGGNLGIFGSNGTSDSVFAIEFDTYINSAWDPSYRHVGIDIGSRNSAENSTVDDAIIGQQVNARINYEGEAKIISVHVSIPGLEPVDFRYGFNLKGFLTEKVQVGLSASTGEYVAKHDIVSWHFTSTIAGVMGAKIQQFV